MTPTDAIPPASESELGWSLLTHYLSAWPQVVSHDFVRGLIRRCHAAEAALAEEQSLRKRLSASLENESLRLLDTTRQLDDERRQSAAVREENVTLRAERDALLNKRCDECGAFAVNCVTAEHCASCELDRYEAKIAAVREVLRPILGKEPCPTCCNGSVSYWDTGTETALPCEPCSGTGTRDVIDGCGLAEAVERVVKELAAAKNGLASMAEHLTDEQADCRRAEAERDAANERIGKLQVGYALMLAERDTARAAVVAMRERAANMCAPGPLQNAIRNLPLEPEAAPHEGR